MDPITLRLNKMRRDARRLQESKVSSSERKRIEKILNYHLGSHETSLSVIDLQLVEETPTTKSFNIDYAVDVEIPVGTDYETGQTEYEYDTEYRNDVIVFTKEELGLQKVSSNRDMDEDLTMDDDPEETEQKYSSAKTSINSAKLPALFNMVTFEKGSLNLDYGGGKFDNVAEYLMDKYEATNLVYDKYNRTSEHNHAVLDQVRKNGGADTVTCSNVLNVIAEESERLAVLRNCKRFLKSGGTCYITVYEGSGTGTGAETKSGYQLNRKTAGYEDEIKQVFSSVTRKGKLFICQ